MNIVSFPKGTSKNFLFKGWGEKKQASLLNKLKKKQDKLKILHENL